MLNNIYVDNLQRTYVVGLIQNRIDQLETYMKNNQNEQSDEYQNDYEEFCSLRDFLFYYS